MPNSELHPSLPQWMRDVNSRLLAFITEESETLSQAGQMIIGTRGKRLRPVLLLLSCASLGEVTPRATLYAALVEMIHTASLAHDDVIDEADSRRGGLSAPARWGNKLSVLVGDFLLARVFEASAHDGDLRLLHLLSNACTAMGRAVVTECAEMDIDAGEDVYFSVVHGKTGTLFAAATAIGACIGGATPVAEQEMLHFGLAFGSAFQLADDLLDLQGQDESGKPRGADWAQRKATLPLLHALRVASAPIAAEIRALWQQDPFTPEHARALAYLVETAGGFDYGWRKVKEYRTQALARLDCLPDGPGRDALRLLCTEHFPLPVMPTAV